MSTAGLRCLIGSHRPINAGIYFINTTKSVPRPVSLLTP